jgi:hypothetical protein
MRSVHAAPKSSLIRHDIEYSILGTDAALMFVNGEKLPSFDLIRGTFKSSCFRLEPTPLKSEVLTR